MTRAALLELAPPGGWIAIDPRRLGPPVGQARGLLHRVAMRAARSFGRDQVPNLFLTLLRSPRLLLPWTWFASRMMPWGRLDPLDRERMILRIAWNCRCRYEWVQHLDLGLAAGLSAAEIGAVVHGPDEQPGALQRSLLRACDELHRGRRVEDQTWSELRAALTDEQLLEVLLLVGHYEGLAGLLNSTGVVVEREVLTKLAGG